MQLGNLWTQEVQHSFTDMRHAILKDLCLRGYDHCKLLVLCTDFSAKGFGYVALQPANNNAYLAAMHRNMHGGFFDFMTRDSTATLHSVAFGCRHMQGNKKRLHSHLGEAFALDYGINKCRHMAFGQQFVCVIDCYALKFILSDDGKYLAILQLQMRFMCWDMVVEHCIDHCLANAGYNLCIGADLYYNPFMRLHSASCSIKMLQPSTNGNSNCTQTSVLFLWPTSHCTKRALTPTTRDSADSSPH